MLNNIIKYCGGHCTTLHNIAQYCTTMHNILIDSGIPMDPDGLIKMHLKDSYSKKIVLSWQR